MQTSIDGAGRLVVPKALRDALGFQPGTRLDVRIRDGRLEVEAVPTPMRLVPRGRSLVAATDVPLPTIDADDVRAVLESVRR